MNRDNLIKANDIIIDRLNEHLKDKNYQKTTIDLTDGNESTVVFKGEDIAYCVVYDEEILQFELRSCMVDSDNELDQNWNKLTAWLYDSDKYTAKDAANIAEDFVDTLGGTKRIAAAKKAKAKKKKGEEGTVDSLFLMNRLINVWPELKTDIQYERENYETFRGVMFTREKVLPKFTMLLNGTDTNKKKKLFNLLNDEYRVGNMDVRSIITIVLLNSVEDNKIEDVETYLSDELKKAFKYSRKIKGKKIKPEVQKKKKEGFMARTLAESQKR